MIFSATDSNCLAQWSEMTLNYRVMVEGYPNLKEEVGGLNPDYEISSLLDIKLARWWTASCALALACRPSVAKRKEKKRKSCSILIVTCNNVSPTLNGNPTLFVIPCKFLWGLENYSVAITVTYQVVLASKFWSSMTIFHLKLLTRESRVLANGWTPPSSMTIFVKLFIRSVIQKLTIVT